MERHPFQSPLILRIIAAASISALIASCVSLEKAAPPVAELSLPKSADIPKMEEGHEIYATSCVKCHWPMRIYKHTDEQWTDNILPKMCAKAKLTIAQSDAVKTYVLTARNALAATPPN